MAIFYYKVWFSKEEIPSLSDIIKELNSITGLESIVENGNLKNDVLYAKLGIVYNENHILIMGFSFAFRKHYLLVSLIQALINMGGEYKWETSDFNSPPEWAGLNYKLAREMDQSIF